MIDNKNLLPEQLTSYHPILDILTVYEGIVLTGERIIKPQALRGDVKKRLQAAHMGKNSMLRRA